VAEKLFMPDQSPPSFEYQVFDPEHQEIRVFTIHPPKRRYWLHILLFLLTVLTTLCIGARLQYNFDHNLPAFTADLDYWPWQWALSDLSLLKLGIPFSASLLGILTAHEFGHFVYCVRRRVYATLPFFIPAPTLIGTLGAFIRIMSPFRSRSDLFDIGIAGPIAGFVVGVPVLMWGLALSHPVTVDTAQPGIAFGLPLVFHVAHWLLAAIGNPVNSRLPLSEIHLHSVAIAAWVGMFATSLNLIPGGQLDGGHILYALKPQWHKRISFLTITVLLVLSWYYWAGWIVWAIILRLTGARHPHVPLGEPVNRKRWWLGAFAALMFLLTFTPAGIKQRDDDTGKIENSSLQRQLESYRQERMKRYQEQNPQPTTR
jgi:Zn-dependent protease